MEFFNFARSKGRLNTRRMIVFGALFFLFHLTFAQETVGIGIAGTSTLNPNALLHLNSVNQGFLLPRMTTAQRTSISSPADGLWVFDTNHKAFFIYKLGTGWQELSPVLPDMVMMWHGNLNLFDNSGLGKGRMSGWAICNGQNNTIDLSSRFIVGYNSANTNYNTQGKTGGVRDVTLTTAQMPAHSHTFSDAGHSHTASLANNGKHTHSFSLTNNSTGTSYGKVDDGTGTGYNNLSISRTDTLSNEQLSVSINSSTADLSIKNTGGGTSHENRPSYMAMIFIQKL